MRFLSLFLSVILFSIPAFAQKKVTPTKGFVSAKTSMWEEAKGGKNLVARFRLKSSKLIQVDVRSAEVPTASAKQYFTTFHNSLIKSGMKKGKSGPTDLLKDKEVVVTEYEMKRKNELYNVLVYELHQNGNAWLLLAVTPAKKRGALDESLPQLLKSFTFP